MSNSNNIDFSSIVDEDSNMQANNTNNQNQGANSGQQQTQTQPTTQLPTSLNNNQAAMPIGGSQGSNMMQSDASSRPPQSNLRRSNRNIEDLEEEKVPQPGSNAQSQRSTHSMQDKGLSFNDITGSNTKKRTRNQVKSPSIDIQSPSSMPPSSKRQRVSSPQNLQSAQPFDPSHQSSLVDHEMGSPQQQPPNPWKMPTSPDNSARMTTTRSHQSPQEQADLAQYLGDQASRGLQERSKSNSQTTTLPTCQICIDHYDRCDRRPLVLPCGHTFCMKCLQNRAMEIKRRCPTCKDTYVGSAHLKTNYILLGMLPSPQGSQEQVPLSTMNVGVTVSDNSSSQEVTYQDGRRRAQPYFSRSEFRETFKDLRAILVNGNGRLVFELLSISRSQLSSASYSRYKQMLTSALRNDAVNWELERFKTAILSEQQFLKLRDLAVFYNSTIEQYPQASSYLKPIDFDEEQIDHQVHREIRTSLQDSILSDRQVEQNANEMKSLKTFYYRKCGNFMAIQPPKNKELEIIGFTYKQPKSIKNSSIISDIGLAQNYRLLVRRTDDVGVFNFHAPIELNISQLPNTLSIFTPESQRMIRDYMQQYFQVFKQYVRNHKDLQWSSGGQRERSPARPTSMNSGSHQLMSPQPSVVPANHPVNIMNQRSTSVPLQNQMHMMSGTHQSPQYISSSAISSSNVTPQRMRQSDSSDINEDNQASARSGLDQGNGILKSNLKPRDLQELFYSVVGKPFRKAGVGKKHYDDAYQSFKNAWTRGIASEWFKCQFEEQPLLTLNYVILKELLVPKSETPQRMTAFLQSLIVNNYEECSDFERAKAYKEMLDSAEENRASYWASMLEAERERERQSRDSKSSREEIEPRQPREQRQIRPAAQSAFLNQLMSGQVLQNQATYNQGPSPQIQVQPLQNQPLAAQVQAQPPSTSVPIQLQVPGSNAQDEDAFESYREECKSTGTPQFIRMSQWMQWVAYSQMPQRLIMSPHRWGWWQNYNATHGTPLGERLARSLFDMCDAEDVPVLLPTDTILKAFEMVLRHLQPLV